MLQEAAVMSNENPTEGQGQEDESQGHVSVSDNNKSIGKQ